MRNIGWAAHGDPLDQVASFLDSIMVVTAYIDNAEEFSVHYQALDKVLYRLNNYPENPKNWSYFKDKLICSDTSSEKMI